MHLILGFGATGASFLRYTRKNKIPVIIFDTRDNPPGLTEFEDFNEEIYSGDLVNLNSKKELNLLDGLVVE